MHVIYLFVKTFVACDLDLAVPIAMEVQDRQLRTMVESLDLVIVFIAIVVSVVVIIFLSLKCLSSPTFLILFLPSISTLKLTKGSRPAMWSSLKEFITSTTVGPKCFQPVVVEVKEDEPAGHFQVVDPLDEVVLETVRGIWIIWYLD